MKTKSKLFYVILICMLAVIFAALTACGDEQEGSATPTDSYIISTPGAADGQPTGNADGTPTATPTQAPTPTPIISAYPTEGTRPEDFGMKTEIMVNGSIVSNYSRENFLW